MKSVHRPIEPDVTFSIIQHLNDMTNDKRKDKKRTSRQGKIQQQRRQQGLWSWMGISAVLLIILGGTAWTLRDKPTPEALASLPDEISIDQAYQLYEEGVFVLDVRTPQEWDEYHAPDTTLIPLDELESRVDELPRGQKIVVVCRSGNRSQVGRDILRQAGFEQVTSMSGGLKAWGAAGYPLVASSP
jgi:rhodanese-related sulfurtransferase